MKKITKILLVVIITLACGSVFAQSYPSAKLPEGIAGPGINPATLPGDICIPCAIPEGEPIILEDGEDVTNGGCNLAPELFTNINLEDAICGITNTYYFEGGGYRDTDWYKLVLTSPTTVYWSVYSGIDGVSYILAPPCPSTIVTAAYSLANTPLTLSATLPAGTYYFLWTTRYWLGNEVSAPYMVKLSTTPPGDPATWCTTPIPTMTEWGLIILGIALLSFGTFFILRMNRA